MEIRYSIGDQSRIMTDKDKITKVFTCIQCDEDYPIDIRATNDSGLDVTIYDDIVDSLVVKCSRCGQQLVTLDAGIKNDIIDLNRAGYRTTFSCEGHGFNDPGYISFAFTPETKSLEDMEPPKYWALEKTELASGAAYILRTIDTYASDKVFKTFEIDYHTFHKLSLDSLHEWVHSLLDVWFQKKTSRI